jgi:hypothetical protein
VRWNRFINFVIFFDESQMFGVHRLSEYSCLRACLSRIYFSRKLKREHGFCTEILSQIVVWYKKDDVTKKNRLSHVTSCLEIVTKKACLFAIQILDSKHAC